MQEWSLKTKYGMSLDDYNALLVKQNHVCAVCNNAETKIHPKSGKLQPLSVHHCHSTGRVIALYCHRCNVASGMFGDDPELMRRAAALMEGGDYHR